MARLWQDVVLFQRNLTCAIVRPEDRKEYLDALQQADDGDLNPLVQLVVQRVISTLDKYLDAQQRLDELGGWARTLVGETSVRAAEARRLSYMRWARKMEELRYEFQRCAALITRASSDIDVQFRPYEMIDEIDWEMLRSGSSVSKSWFFKLHFHHGPSRLTYVFFFGKHYWSEMDARDDRSEPRICLLVSESETGKNGIRLDGGSVQYPTLREVVATGDTFVRKRYNPDTNQEIQEPDTPATQIARDFIEEVMLRRLP